MLIVMPPMSLVPRSRHPASPWRAVASISVLALLLAGGLASCRSTPNAGDTGDTRRSGARCDPDGPGTLRIANSSGRVLDVYVSRPAGTPQMLTQVSPGTASLPVRGPSDIGVRYDVIDPNGRRLLSSVAWSRRTGREVMSGVVVELTCTPVSGVPTLSREK
jgi:hypothetical protein